MSVTLKMIAKEAEVSVMAVSAALNQTTRTRISAETRERICRIAAKLGYRPNVLAQTLSGGSSRILGVVIDSHLPTAVIAILRGVERTAGEHGLRIMIAEQHESPQNIAELCDTFDQYGVEGILCLAHDYPRQQASIRKIFHQRRNILFWEAPQGIDAPYVSLDHRQAYAQVLSSWRKCGRKRPAIAMDTSGNRHLQLRLQAFQNAAQECGYTPEIIDVHAWPEAEDIHGLMQKALRAEILPRGIDAILTESDLWGAALLQAARLDGIDVPERLAVVGWDNSPFCQTLLPPLASIDLKLEELGHSLVEMFLALKQGAKPQPHAIPVRFVNRASSGIPAAP